MVCQHPKVQMYGAGIVDRPGQPRRMRAYCHDCQQFVECESRIVRGRVEAATDWVTSDHTIFEPEFDFKIDGDLPGAR